MPSLSFSDEERKEFLKDKKAGNEYATSKAERRANQLPPHTFYSHDELNEELLGPGKIALALLIKLEKDANYAEQDRNNTNIIHILNYGEEEIQTITIYDRGHILYFHISPKTLDVTQVREDIAEAFLSAKIEGVDTHAYDDSPSELNRQWFLFLRLGLCFAVR